MPELLINEQKFITKKSKTFSMVVLGNGPAFLQTIVMLEDKDIIPITNNDADFLTLERLGAKPQKKDFQSNVLSFIGENSYNIVLISSTLYTHQIIKALESNLKKDQVLLIVKHPKMHKTTTHPYTFYIDTKDQFDNRLWHRSMALCRLVKMNEFFLSKMTGNKKTLKLLIVFFGPPDPDAIASSNAFARLFSKLAVTTYASTGKVKRFENRAMLSYLKISVLDISLVNLNDYDITACFDAQPSFFKNSGYNINFDICIDHHPEAPDNPNISFFDVRKHHGSCSTILAQYYYYSKKTLPKILATALLFGIKTDTANFTRSAYDPDVNMMTFLNQKSDHQFLKRLDFSTIPKRAIKYFRRAYNRLNFERNYIYCHLGRVGYMDIGSIIAEQLLKIQKVYLSVVSLIYRDKIIVSFRSVRINFHAGELAAKLFTGSGVGGGHAEMGRAECMLSNLPYNLKDLDDKIMEFLKSAFKDVKQYQQNIAI